MSKNLNWFRFDPARGLAVIHGLSNSDAGKWCKQFFVDLIMSDPSCSDQLAASMILERAAFQESKRKGGEKGAAIRYGIPIADDMSPIGHLSDTHSHTDERDGTDGRTIKPEDFRTEEFSGDKYEKIKSIPDSRLPAWASRYCGDSDPDKGGGAFKKQMMRIGADEFRSVLLAFVGECESGEEPRNRGSALMARMKKANPAGLGTTHKAEGANHGQ